MEKEQKTIFQIYIGFAAVVIFNFIPSSAVQTFGGILFIVLIVAAYIYRAKAQNNSVMHSHMAYLIKSFWIASLFLSIGIAAALALADHSIIYDAVDGVINGQMISEAQMNQVLMAYLHDNLLIFSLTFGPSILYMAYRVMKGMIRVKKNQIIANPKNWF